MISHIAGSRLVGRVQRNSSIFVELSYHSLNENCLFGFPASLQLTLFQPTCKLQDGIHHQKKKPFELQCQMLFPKHLHSHLDNTEELKT